MTGNREKKSGDSRQGDYLWKSPSSPSGKYYHTILDNIDTIVFVTDRESYEILYANKFARDLFGDIVGKNCWEALRSGMPEPCPLCGEEDLLGDDGRPTGTFHYEFENTVTRRWYEVQVRLVELAEDEIVRLHFVTDITDKKQILSALSISEEKYRTVADYTYDWECWIREDKSFVYVSPSCERITGYRADEFLADPSLPFKIIHPDDLPLFEFHQEQAFASDEYSHLDYRIITKAGEERWISHYCQPVYNRDGQFIGRRSSNRDITERVESERKTKLNELRLQTLVKLYEKKELPMEEVCEFVLESSLPITFSSVGFMGFLDENEIFMKIHTWSQSVKKDIGSKPKTLEFNVWKAGMLGEAVRRRYPVVVNDFSSHSSARKAVPAGHLEITRFLAVPLLFDNRVVAVLAVANKDKDYTHEDIDQLRLLLEGMWQILLKKKAEENLARQSDKIKRFVNAVSHDLKSPAVSAHGFAVMLEKKYSDVLDKKGLKYCEQIIKAAEQITALAEDINTYISSKDNGCEFESLELNELWETVREEFVPQLKKRNIDWRAPDLEYIEIRGNRMGLLRVFRNLIDNALKYGGKSLTEIVLGYESSGEHHVLTVKNDGAVILPDDEKIIFEEFARKTSNPHIYGSGLGLSIVREIAKRHRGTAWLTTCEKGKPVFCISLSKYL